MKIEQATIEIRPRRASELVDLALAFYRAHFWQLLVPTLIFGLPLVTASLLIHWISGMAWAALLFFWALWTLPSGALVLSASRLVFDLPASWSTVRAVYRPVAARLLLWRIGQKLIQLILTPVVIGWSLRLKWSFTPMIVLLEQLWGIPLTLRRRTLYRRGGASAFVVEVFTLIIAAGLVLSIVFLFDLIFSDILSMWETWQLFLGALQSPLQLGLWLVAVLFVAPIVDLVWFFFYLDARIRGEGWDLELGFRSVAARLGRAGEVRG